MERGKLKMADVSNKGVIYMSSVSMAKSFNNLRFQPIRYTIESPDNTIIYIKRENSIITNSGITREIHGNGYYLLSNGPKNIRLDCVDVYVRGEASGARYDSDEMDSFLINSDMYDITSNTQYSMGGGGMNGYIKGSGVPVGFASTIMTPIRGDMYGKMSGETANVNLTDDPSSTRFSISATALRSQYALDYTSTSEYPIYRVGNFYNKYSSKYYDTPDSEWWTDMTDLRTFYKANQMYDGGLYNDYLEKLPENETFDGFPLFLNLHTTHNLEEAKKYLKDGTIPSDDTYIKSDDGEPPKGKEDSGGDDDDMDGMNNTSHTERQSIVNSPTNNYYILEYNGLNTFCNWFWNDILTLINGDYTLLGDYAYNMLTGAYGDLNQYVTSLRKLNVNIDTFFTRKTNQHIKIGRYSLDTFACDAISSDKPDMPLLAEIQVPMCHSKKENKPTFGSFLDYPPYTSVSIYIPFIGIVPIDGNMVVGRTIRLYGAVDVIAGTIHYNVFVLTPKKEQSLIGSYEGKCGVDIPLALDNSMQNSTNILKNVADVTTGLCTKSPSALLNVGSGIFTEPISNLGAQTTNTTYYNPNKCALIMQSAIGNTPSNFGSTCGYMWCKSATLSDLTGLTICKNPRIGKFDDNTPTETERSEIYSLLESGVII